MYNKPEKGLIKQASKIKVDPPNVHQCTLYSVLYTVTDELYLLYLAICANLSRAKQLYSIGFDGPKISSLIKFIWYTASTLSI